MRIRLNVLGLAALLEATCLAAAAPAAHLQAEGRIKEFVFTSANELVETTSDVAAPVPDMSATLELRGNALLVTFCAETDVEGTLLVGATVDGVLLAPGEVILHEDLEPPTSPRTQSHCHVWAGDELSPGPHTVEMTWRKLGTPPGSGFAQLHFRSLTVAFF